jgi:hypothetical protein
VTSNVGARVGRCGLCNRPLEDEQSLQFGYGPTCWARLSAVAGSAGAGDQQGASGQTCSPTVLRTPLTVAGTAQQARPTGGREQSGAHTPVHSPVVTGGWGGSPGRPRTFERPGDSPALVALGWLLVLGSLVVVVDYWRWVVLGIAALTLLATASAIRARVSARRHVAGPPRSYRL